jgi:hypothetical protein
MEEAWTAGQYDVGAVLEEPRLANGIRTGTIVRADPARGVSVRFDGSPDEVRARSTVALTPRDAGREVLLVFENGALTSPIIVGVIQERAVSPAGAVTIDAKQITLDASEELTLRSGKASITLLGDGRIVIKGMEIVSRARGTHKVKGGTVQIN